MADTTDDTIETKGKFAVLVADAFQDSEFFLPKIEIAKLGYEIEIVSVRKEPVDMWSFFGPIGKLTVDKSIDEASADDYAGVLIPGGAKSPSILSKSEAVRKFVAEIDAQGKLVACICRGGLLAAKAGVAKGRNITGFHDPDKWPELAISETVEELGGIWHNDQAAIVDGNLISSRHPDDADAFTGEIANWLERKAA